LKKCEVSLLDSDNSGYIDYNEFKTVFSANLGPDAIPFDFDCDWIKLYLGKKNGAHVLGCELPRFSISALQLIVGN